MDQKTQLDDVKPDVSTVLQSAPQPAPQPSIHQVDVIQVLRTAQQHHVQLGLIADQKANIVLGSFLVFITVTQSILKTNENLSVPIWVLTIGYTIAAIFALLVIAPRFRDKKVSKGTPPANLMFFGSFSRLTQDQYLEQMTANLATNADAREMMIKDIYQIGQVLQKKYRNLRLSYTCLAGGIVASMIAFSVTSLLM
ncbi:MAG: Pycsar system effector family protein [Gammaproteobacteria bacterium]